MPQKLQLKPPLADLPAVFCAFVAHSGGRCMQAFVTNATNKSTDSSVMSGQARRGDQQGRRALRQTRQWHWGGRGGHLSKVLNEGEDAPSTLNPKTGMHATLDLDYLAVAGRSNPVQIRA